MALIVFALITIKLATNRKLFDVFLIYIIAFLVLFIVQAAILWPFIFWELNDEVLFLVGQSLTCVTTVLMHWKVALYEIFLMIKQKMILTLCVIIFYSTAYGLFIVFQFNVHYLFEELFLLGMLVIITLIGFLATFFTAQTKIDQTSDRYHDLVNKFTGLYLAIEAHDVPEEIKDLSREMRKYVTGKEQVQSLTDNYEVNFGKILIDKLTDSRKMNELVMDIEYHEHHATVSLGDVTYMLGSLFDNALEHGLDQPIFVYLNVSENIFELSVKNSCQRIPDRKLAKLFKKGVSTKEQIGRGQGLYKLKHEVEAYNDQRFKAEIRADCYYDLTYACDYLEMTIEID
jgi:signal transduction histidine kinase